MTTPSTPVLVADIGGTNARFALVDLDDPLAHPRSARTLAVSDYGSLGDAARDYLDGLVRTNPAGGAGASQRADGPPGADAPCGRDSTSGPGSSQGAGAPARPRRAAMAVATPITGDHVKLTNSPWSFSIDALRRQLQLDELQIINDFTALAWALPLLPPGALRQVGGGTMVSTAARGLIGPGTGLGVSGLIPAPGGGWVALDSEGGHCSMSPRDTREAAILAVAWRSHPHVSFERLVSGTGLPLLAQAVAEVDRLPLPMAADAITGEAVTAAAAHGDPACQAVVQAFCAMLGTAASNLALTLGARGGIYIGGGIVPHLGPAFERSTFRERFESHGRHSSYLREIPTFVIDGSGESPALSGVAHALRGGTHTARPDIGVDAIDER